MKEEKPLDVLQFMQQTTTRPKHDASSVTCNGCGYTWIADAGVPTACPECGRNRRNLEITPIS